jgi:hypothetical protein
MSIMTKKAEIKRDTKTNTKVSVNVDKTPILYSDNILLSINENGVVLDVAQRVRTSNRLRIVSRVGMSKKYAKVFVTRLGKLLILSDGKSKKRGSLVN